MDWGHFILRAALFKRSFMRSKNAFKEFEFNIDGLNNLVTSNLSQKNQIWFTHKSCKTRAGLVWSSDVELQREREREKLKHTLSKSNKTLLFESSPATFPPLPPPPIPPTRLTSNFHLTCGRHRKLPLCSPLLPGKVNTGQRSLCLPASCSPRQQGPSSPSPVPERRRGRRVKQDPCLRALIDRKPEFTRRTAMENSLADLMRPAPHIFDVPIQSGEEKSVRDLLVSCAGLAAAGLQSFQFVKCHSSIRTTSILTTSK